MSSSASLRATTASTLVGLSMAAVSPAAAATAILDFGTQGAGGVALTGSGAVWTENGQSYNGVTRQTATGGGNVNDLYTSPGLTALDGSATTWAVDIDKNSVGTGGDIGSQPISGVWGAGDPAAAASPFTGLSINALGDGFYINNRARLVINFTGLNAGFTYNIATFAALSGTTSSTPGLFSLVTGTSASTTTQTLDVDSNRTNGVVAQWLAVTPDANGNISISVSTTDASSTRTELNAVSIEQIPEPGSLGLAALAGLAALRRRRR